MKLQQQPFSLRAALRRRPGRCHPRWRLAPVVLISSAASPPVDRIESSWSAAASAKCSRLLVGAGSQRVGALGAELPIPDQGWSDPADRGRRGRPDFAARSRRGGGRRVWLQHPSAQAPSAQLSRSGGCDAPRQAGSLQQLLTKLQARPAPAARGLPRAGRLSWEARWKWARPAPTDPCALPPVSPAGMSDMDVPRPQACPTQTFPIAARASTTSLRRTCLSCSGQEDPGLRRGGPGSAGLSRRRGLMSPLYQNS